MSRERVVDDTKSPAVLGCLLERQGFEVVMVDTGDWTSMIRARRLVSTAVRRLESQSTRNARIGSTRLARHDGMSAPVTVVATTVAIAAPQTRAS